ELARASRRDRERREEKRRERRLQDQRRELVMPRRVRRPPAAREVRPELAALGDDLLRVETQDELPRKRDRQPARQRVNDGRARGASQRKTVDAREEAAEEVARLDREERRDEDERGATRPRAEPAAARRFRERQEHGRDRDREERGELD